MSYNIPHTTTLLQRFTRASSPGYPRYWTEADARELYYESPKKLDALVKIAASQARESEAQAKRIVSSFGTEFEGFANRITHEIREQTDVLTAVFSAGADEISASVEFAADRICANLEEITWGLAQISGQIETLIDITQYKRRTEAVELLQQAIRHMRVGNHRDAQERLLRSLELDNTDYQVLYNLGLVSVHLDLSTEAINYFHSAARVPEGISQEAKARALFSEARVYFASDCSDKAFKIMEECHGLRRSGRDFLYASIYAFHSSQEKKAREMLRSAVATNTSQYAAAAVHEELEPYRKVVFEVLRALDAEAISHFTKVAIRYQQFHRPTLIELTALHFFPALRSLLDHADVSLTTSAHSKTIAEISAFVCTVENLESCSAETAEMLMLAQSLATLHEKSKAVKADSNYFDASPTSFLYTSNSPLILYLAVGILWQLGNTIVFTNSAQTTSIYHQSGAFFLFIVLFFSVLWPLTGLLTILNYFTSNYKTEIETSNHKFAVLWLFASIIIVVVFAMLLYFNAKSVNKSNSRAISKLEVKKTQLAVEISEKNDRLQVLLTEVSNVIKKSQPGFQQLLA